MEVGSSGPAVKLSLTHTIERDASKFIAAVSRAWPMVISNLKSLLETGSIVLQKPLSPAKWTARQEARPPRPPAAVARVALRSGGCGKT